jgi:hypothetical protein
MARQEKGHGQIRLKLPYMPTLQTKETKDTRMAQTTGSTTTTMERPEYGFHGGTARKQWIQCHMGGSQQVLKDEAFGHMSKRYG